MLTEAEFRTDVLERGDRFAGWQQCMNHVIAPMEITSPHADDFWADYRLLRLEDTFLWPARLHASRYRRTPRLIRQSDPGLLHMTLVLPGSGAVRVEQGEVRSAVEAHDVYFLDTSRPSDVRTDDEPIVGVGVDIPRSLLPLPMNTSLDDVLGRGLSGRHGFGALLTQFVTHLVDQADAYGPADAARLHRVLLDLAAGLLSGGLGQETALSPETRTRNLVLTIRSFIGSNLHDPRLTPGAVAAAHHISARHLHRLFHQEGTTVAALIRNLRLERACRDLVDPRLADTPVHTIAARCGFGAPAHFSRVFRAAQGMSPRDFRDAALRERSQHAR
ncbi:helix-turn-helix domain-containing protein [Streptomyces anulatus]|uniref:helix-turn-helix domain-containing protein n=1 Tax=Streptomyces anulatus TaxID=1892 RepID=UPI00224E3894|nr:helix-turn-helix domain-containing protein [Streptomyces anulatus]MCX4516249.1 helix-turn-helix domain-containing protein [Streptomyces anulatus]MCX4599076.1 helix-turn-helix domain-containing protein [Streptomyces anulatus]WSI75561.1 helix-turn-helix domain-containing protein [Streptomyces anulatus]WTD07924.1 helix-turn-helix domain-containing protein [Streptomyces anulatus]WTE01213.1 helix-turn-helix domain-containing protein [Streptomyces anulatus]